MPEDGKSEDIRDKGPIRDEWFCLVVILLELKVKRQANGRDDMDCMDVQMERRYKENERRSKETRLWTPKEAEVWITPPGQHIDYNK